MLGAAEVGMLRALQQHSIVPDVIIGSSVGSVERMAEIWTGLSRRGVFGGSIFGQLGTLARHGTYLHSNEALRTILDGELGEGTVFSDLAVRFECIAASIERAAPHWFSAGPVVPAVLASCAVPGLLPAVHIDGEHFFDGGLVRSVPVGRAVELGAQRIFVLHVGHLEQPLHAPTRPWHVALVAFEIARRHHFEEEVGALSDDVELHVLPSGASPPTLSVRYRSTSGVSKRIEDAYAASCHYLDRTAAG
jgi:NTE family protein